jgi:hypothetical protein
MTNWTTFLYALLPHPTQPLVLVQSGPTGITLPNKSHNDRVWASDMHTLQPALEELAGTPVNVLRYVAYHRDEDTSELYYIYLLEPRNGVLPPNTLWQPLEKILENTDMPSALRDGLVQWQMERQSGIIPERRAPWAFPGWHAKVENWIANQVARLGRGIIHNIAPVKSWSISCVSKVHTESGILYFKMARDLPLFVNEGVVLTHLAKLYPDRVPLPVALEAEQGWFLLDDLGNKPDGDASLEEQARLMQDFARVQIDSSQNIEALLVAGCKDRRLETLLSQIEPLLNDELALSLLNPDEREKIKRNAPHLRELLVELISLPIPVALLHGDLHAGNVIPRGDSFLYFDWTDAAVSHPFFDMIHIFMKEDETQKTALQEAYLLVWEASFSRADVRRAWQLASALYGFYHAVSYQYIVHGIEELVLPELNFTHYFLRKLLAGLDQLQP